MELAQARYAGLDGCRGAWIAVFLDEEGHSACERVEELHSLNRTGTALHLVLIDIPIGLTDGKAGSSYRTCDREVRRLLGRGRASSVFAPPCREALQASSHAEACAINRRVLGTGISVQSFHIMPKIREADLWLRHSVPGFAVRECHPELAFQALNGGAALSDRKKTAAGRDQRLAILDRYLPGAELIFANARSRITRRQAADDDLVDAMALAVTARLAGDGLSSVPAEPEIDAFGLTMEMVFAGYT